MSKTYIAKMEMSSENEMPVSPAKSYSYQSIAVLEGI